MRKTKVCHLTSVHFALDTRIFYRFCVHLKKDYDVTLIGVHPKEEWVDGVHIIPFRRYKNKMLRLLFTWAVMFFKAIRVRAKIYQLHDPELIPCGLLLRLCGKKVILDIHENIAEDIFDKPWIRYKRVLYFLFRLFEWPATRYFTIFLAERSYETRYRNLWARYTTVLNYPDIEFFKPFQSPVQRFGNRIFYIGILLESRGILEIVEAIHILKKEGVEVYFDVVGELYTGLAAELDALPFYDGIRHQVHFHGRLSLEQGYEISRNAAAGICIIHPMKNSIESYPTKMFEYMAIGLPQITSGFPLYRSVVETHQCGICVDPHNVLEIAEAIKSILHNHDLAKKMRENGMAAAPNYSWNSEMDKVKSVYRRLEGNGKI